MTYPYDIIRIGLSILIFTYYFQNYTSTHTWTKPKSTDVNIYNTSFYCRVLTSPVSPDILLILLLQLLKRLPMQTRLLKTLILVTYQFLLLIHYDVILLSNISLLIIYKQLLLLQILQMDTYYHLPFLIQLIQLVLRLCSCI